MELIRSVRNSPKAVELLRDKTGGLGLIKPVPTRWIYWFYAFERLLRTKRATCVICNELNIIHSMGPVQWQILESVTEILQPFAQAVTKLEGERYVTISEVYPTLYSLNKKLDQPRQRMFSGIVPLACKLVNTIKQRFKRVLDEKSNEFDPIFVLATLLDIRYALLLEGDLLKAVEDELVKMAATYGTATAVDNVSNNESTKVHDLGDDLLAIARFKVEERHQMNPQTNSSAQIENEFKMYMIDIKSTQMRDPLAYWREKKNALPILYSIAVDVLAVPATSAPVERVFSKASLVLQKNRHNLSDEKMELEVFFKFNSHFIPPHSNI